MAFETTAIGARPLRLSEIVGQDFVVTTLVHSLTQKKMAHAYLFHGPRGVGKTSAARILARSVNCQRGISPEPCDQCPNCRDILQGKALDVREIDGATNTGIDDVRELREEILFTPNSSMHRVYIIDEIHMLSHSAFNALLKTIEEPPPHILFIFVTTEIHRVPLTIRSRCQQFSFKLIPLESIQECLLHLSRRKDVVIDPEALLWIARKATGSLRDAYTFYDQMASFSGNTISMEKIQEKIGLTTIDKIGTLAKMIREGRGSEVFTFSHRILMEGVSVEQLCFDLAEHYKGLLLLHHGVKDDLLLPLGTQRYSKEMREGYTTSQLEEAIRRILTLYRDMRHSFDQRLEWDLLLSQLLALPSFIPQQELVSRIEKLKCDMLASEQEKAKPHSNESPKRVVPTSPEESVAPDLLQDKKAIIETLRKNHPSLASILEKAIDWKQSGKTLFLHLPNAYSVASVKKNAPLLERLLEQRYQISITISPQHSEKTIEGRLDSKIELVRNAFRGEILEGGER